MIGSLRGTVLDRLTRTDHQAELLVEVGGVGYRVTVPARPADGHGEIGSLTFLYVHTHVREDAIVLYGFGSREERDCFEILLSAHGVGPSVAVSMLSVLSPYALGRAVLSDDTDALTVVPGIGKKTAARLVLDLRARFETTAFAGPAGSDGPRSRPLPGRGTEVDVGQASQREQVKAALTSLGYAPEEVRQALARLEVDRSDGDSSPGDSSAEDMLRAALRELAG